MISFASLFVGLVFGIVNVQLIAAAGVERVDLLLDGSRVAELREPFLAQVDLGCNPAPHELVAVARDAHGKEVGRVRQWVNRPRANAEAALVLEPGRGDRGRIARLTWRSLTAENPRAITVTFDDKPVRVTDPARIEVPPHDPRTIHVLRAILEFDGNVRTTAEAFIGGPRSAEAVTELTAVAVVLDKGRSMPPAEQLTGWSERDGVPLEVAAVEEGPFDVVFVAEGRRSSPSGGRTSPARTRSSRSSRSTSATGSLARSAGGGAEDDAREHLPDHQPVHPGGRHDRLVRDEAPRPAGLLPKGQRLADAVAVAGLAAAEQERRRAVVLLLGPEAEDGSLRPRRRLRTSSPAPGAALRLVDRAHRLARGPALAGGPADSDRPAVRRRRLRPAREPLEPEDRLGRGDVASPNGRPGRLRGRDPFAR